MKLLDVATVTIQMNPSISILMKTHDIYIAQAIFDERIYELQGLGLEQAVVSSTKTGFVVKYRNYKYSVECLSLLDTEVYMEPFSAPNRNGIYKVGCFRVKGNQITYRIEITTLA
jgi:hypothetical protein